MELGFAYYKSNHLTFSILDIEISPMSVSIYIFGIVRKKPHLVFFLHAKDIFFFEQKIFETIVSDGGNSSFKLANGYNKKAEHLCCLYQSWDQSQEQRIMGQNCLHSPSIEPGMFEKQQDCSSSNF